MFSLTRARRQAHGLVGGVVEKVPWLAPEALAQDIVRTWGRCLASGARCAWWRAVAAIGDLAKRIADVAEARAHGKGVWWMWRARV